MREFGACFLVVIIVGFFFSSIICMVSVKINYQLNPGMWQCTKERPINDTKPIVNECIRYEMGP